MKTDLENEFKHLKETYNDYCFFDGEKNILLSAPHAVSQLRNEMLKSAEPETALIALYFKNKKFPCIIKTKNNNDDANYELSCPYKNKILSCFTNQKIKFFIDFHQLSSKRKMDFCIGIGGDEFNNLLSYSYILTKIKNILQENGYIVEINNPFKAGKPWTNAGFMARKGCPSFQLEINSRLLFNVSDTDFYKVIKALEKVLYYIEKEIYTNEI